MINMKINPCIHCRAGTTGAAFESVPLQYTPSQSERRVTPVFCNAYRFSFLLRSFCTIRICILDKRLQSCRPRTEMPVVWTLRDLRWKGFQFAPSRLTSKMLPQNQHIFEEADFGNIDLI